VPDARANGLARLARHSRAFAMVALDQRESLRTMLAEVSGGAVPDGVLTGFKIDAARALTPYASAILLDVDYGLWPARAAGLSSRPTSTSACSRITGSMTSRTPTSCS
jgi:sulfofructosephosphate aldolase